ncbi:ribonuclease HI family protein [Candidatus Microgenomates bacterium]|nr:ribonuclease HI family protein [Candidatus Microgenomates bacterium]
MLTIFCDGGSRGNPGPAASAFVVLDETGKIIKSEGKFLGHGTNNQAEYTAVLMAFTFLAGLQNQPLKINFFLDSELVVNQLTGRYKIKNKNLLAIIMEIRQKQKNISGKIFFQAIPRSKNKLADALVNKALDFQTSFTD